MSGDTYVNGLSLMIASVSVTIVCRVSSVTYDLPSVFLIQVFVKPIRRSQQPPYQGARFGINFQLVPYADNVELSVVDCVNFCNVSEAAKWVETLSDIKVRGLAACKSSEFLKK